MERISEVLIGEEALKQKVREMAKQIEKDYQGKDLVAVGILKGALLFLADLVKAVDLPLTYDFMDVSSYGASTESSGEVRILKDLSMKIKDKDVLIVEDIIDTGYTLAFLLETLKARKPASIKICCLLNKKDRRKVTVPVDYAGFEIPDAFAVGYGLDYAERYRNLPYIGVLELGTTD
jgi:hypoxanthine phosphoribosyltransferase